MWTKREPTTEKTAYLASFTTSAHRVREANALARLKAVPSYHCMQLMEFVKFAIRLQDWEIPDRQIAV